jgi:hypothetical protein
MVLEEVTDMHSKHRWVRDMDPLYLSQELTLFGYFGYFAEDDPPTVADVGSAQDILRAAER